MLNLMYLNITLRSITLFLKFSKLRTFLTLNYIKRSETQIYEVWGPRKKGSYGDV